VRGDQNFIASTSLHLLLGKKKKTSANTSQQHACMSMHAAFTLLVAQQFLQRHKLLH
jgi:hypothetical protein